MFFIMGISSGQKQLDFDQVEICTCCGKYGHMKVFMTYTYLMFFFIPLFKWNKRYFVRMSCCNSMAELDRETGQGIERGQIHHLDIRALNFSVNNGRLGRELRRCPNCGYTTEENFDFCPKCGNPLNKE